MSEEKRRGSRIPVRITVVLKETTFDGSLYFVSRDISTKGVFVETDILLQEGVIVHIRFLLPDHDEPIRGVGRIVRVEDRVEDGTIPGLGVEFLELEDHSRSMLEEWTAKQPG